MFQLQLQLWGRYSRTFSTAKKLHTAVRPGAAEIRRQHTWIPKCLRSPHIAGGQNALK